MNLEMFSAIVTDFHDTYIIEECKREVSPDEVWIQVESAAINPNDQLFTMGYYGDK